MRIVHIITRLIVGGAQENTLLSCEGQHRAGHEVALLTGPALGPEGSLLRRAESAGYRVEVIDEMRRSILPVRDFRTYHRLARRLRDLRPDVVHTHSSKAGILGRHAADRAGAPRIVHTIHGLAFTASTSRMVNAAYRALERQAAPITDRIVCVADAMARQSLAAGIGRPEQYVTVYSGMEVAPFLRPPRPPGEVRRELGLDERDVVVGTIARLFHLKGHDDLLAVAPGLCARHARLKFLWVGDGILRPALLAEIERLGLRDRFVLSGLVEPQRVPELVHAMDIVVHPSRREGLARVLPQGQLAGKPVVAYDIDGNVEGLLDGRSGYVIAPFDVGQLAATLDLLAGDVELRRRLGEIGRDFAARRFHADAMVAALEQVYRGIARRD